jgi:alkanesulfonate monooxygenase SsuD/methylene tetrahydromethanopterin reductase-like flavin-dependent oxidoreductase (luciferase family)
VYSAAQTICCAKDEATLSRRAASIGRDVAELRAHALAGSPAEVVDQIGSLADAGAQVCYLQVLDLDDIDHLADIAAGVLPQV